MRVIELHAPVKVVQRSKGRSAVAAAAYRCGERLTDERTGLVHDYTRKKGIEGQTLILPDNAPEYAHDREELWNAAEQNEKHPRAQTARDMTVAFPSEFGKEQRAEAGHRIGQWLMFRYGSAVDVALHEPSRKGDQNTETPNYHAHFLFTTRRWDENGNWAKTKDRVLDDLQHGPEEIKVLRLAVADVMNNIAARDRIAVYVEHASYEDRQLDREATQHLGPVATQIEREGKASDIGDKNRAIKARNEERERLEKESNVIDIDAAREQMRVKGKQAPALPPTKVEAYTVFYRDTQTRRAAMLDAFEREHGERERELRRQSAELNKSITGANFFVRAWRLLSGRTRQEKEQLGQVTAEMESIRQRKDEAQAAFEADRRMRLEAMLQQREQQEKQAREALYAKAVGAEHSPTPPRSDYEARRAQFMESRRAPELIDRGPVLPSPEVSQIPSKAAGQTPTKTRPDYEARRDAFFAKRRRGRGEDVNRETRADAMSTNTPAQQSPQGAQAPLVKARLQESSYEARRASYTERMRLEREREDPQREDDAGPSVGR